MNFKYLDLFRHRFVGYSPLDCIIIGLRLFVLVARGVPLRFFMGSARGLVLIGKGAKLRNLHHLFAGKNLIIEDFVELNCLSKRSIILGDRVTIGRLATIRPSNGYGGHLGEGLKIGNNSSIGTYNYIGCSGYIQIGNNVMLGPRVGLFAENHKFGRTDIPIKEQGVKEEFIIIEDDCWIGANSVILSGVTIGKGSIVAAGSIVTHDVPRYSMVAGVPAKLIKSRIAQPASGHDIE